MLLQLAIILAIIAEIFLFVAMTKKRDKKTLESVYAGIVLIAFSLILIGSFVVQTTGGF